MNNKQYQNTNIKYQISDSKKTYLEKNQENKDNYKRPELTYTDKLSKAQVRELLNDYEQIHNKNNLKDVPPGTHIRYFEMKDGELKFRTGGLITINTGLPDYIILSNGKISWSVQVAPCIFFRRITIKQVKDEYQKLLINKETIIKGNQITIQQQSREIKELKDMIRKLQKNIKDKK
jgi:hypothetical protein